ncbi:MAG: NAD(P)-dependent oxidoreductase [Salinivirgaceae bacterium]|jgi:CDP-paratose synthetase|nr:NAD(P)-dependent oxidoreductase [Salinivirgaceae bacterium]
MKIFITGATGFIGKHLVKKLVAKGYEITINLYGNEESPFDSSVSTYQISESNASTDIAYFKEEGFDGIIHLASLYLTVHQPTDAVKLVDSNVRFSTYVLECAAQAGISWFLNTGTFWQCYNNAEYSPVNLYAASKQAFESIARYYIETNQIRFCTLRLSDTYGPNDTRPKIFNLWFKSVKEKTTLDMSPGEQLIDITFIDDIIEAFYMLVTQLNGNTIETGSVFAVKADKRHTLKELAVVFEQATGLKLNINWGARTYREREVMLPWENGEIVSGWKPKIDIDAGLKQMVEKL